MGLTLLLGCVAGPTLHETRRGESVPGPDTTLQPGEMRAEVVQVTPNRNEIQVRVSGHHVLHKEGFSSNRNWTGDLSSSDQ